MPAHEQACPNCGHAVATIGLEPFAKISCPACGALMRVERVFENYVVVEPLGAGGMGSVFKARDTRLNRFVALKLLRKELASDPTFTAKLRDEARITASINHPHVVEVYSVGEEHGQFYVVMELVDGGSLDDKIEDEKHLSEMRTLELGLQVAQGLRAALKAGLIHRDIKPGNILFADENTAKIVDFGLAHLAEQRAENTGEIWGTPYYIAPERLTGEPEDFRSDLYSLGATLFHAASGRTTFIEETHSAAELKKLKAHPIPLHEVASHLSEESAAVIDKMLRPNPADRQASYKELINELRGARALAVAREEELRARWSWPVRIAVSLGILCLTSALIFGAIYGWRHLPKHNALTTTGLTTPEARQRRRSMFLRKSRRRVASCRLIITRKRKRSFARLPILRQTFARSPIYAPRCNFGSRKNSPRPRRPCNNFCSSNRRRNFPGYAITVRSRRIGWMIIRFTRTGKKSGSICLTIPKRCSRGCARWKRN